MGKKLYRQCPHCKSKKGFKLTYSILGNGYEIINFKGKVIDSEKDEVNAIDRDVECLDCGKFIPSEKVEHD